MASLIGAEGAGEKQPVAPGLECRARSQQGRNCRTGGATNACPHLNPKRL